MMVVSNFSGLNSFFTKNKNVSWKVQLLFCFPVQFRSSGLRLPSRVSKVRTKRTALLADLDGKQSRNDHWLQTGGSKSNDKRFLWVPYVEPPTGKLRFKKAKLIRKFPQNPYAALSFKPHCYVAKGTFNSRRVQRELSVNDDLHAGPREVEGVSVCQKN